MRLDWWFFFTNPLPRFPQAQNTKKSSWLSRSEGKISDPNMKHPNIFRWNKFWMANSLRQVTCCWPRFSKCQESWWFSRSQSQSSWPSFSWRGGWVCFCSRFARQATRKTKIDMFLYVILFKDPHNIKKHPCAALPKQHMIVAISPKANINQFIECDVIFDILINRLRASALQTSR